MCPKIFGKRLDEVEIFIGVTETIKLLIFDGMLRRVLGTIKDLLFLDSDERPPTNAGGKKLISNKIIPEIIFHAYQEPVEELIMGIQFLWFLSFGNISYFTVQNMIIYSIFKSGTPINADHEGDRSLVLKLIIINSRRRNR